MKRHQDKVRGSDVQFTKAAQKAHFVLLNSIFLHSHLFSSRVRPDQHPRHRHHHHHPSPSHPVFIYSFRLVNRCSTHSAALVLPLDPPLPPKTLQPSYHLRCLFPSTCRLPLSQVQPPAPPSPPPPPPSALTQPPSTPASPRCSFTSHSFFSLSFRRFLRCAGGNHP